MSTFYLKRGDTTPAIALQLLDGNGDPIDLTGCSVKFLRARPGTTPKVRAATTIDTPLTGAVHYDWQAADTDVAGEYRSEWEITRNGTKLGTVPSDSYDTVVISRDLG